MHYGFLYDVGKEKGVIETYTVYYIHSSYRDSYVNVEPVELSIFV